MLGAKMHTRLVAMNRAPDTKYVMRRPNLSLHGPCNNTPTMFSTSVTAQMLLPGIVLGMVAGRYVCGRAAEVPQPCHAWLQATGCHKAWPGRGCTA